MWRRLPSIAFALALGAGCDAAPTSPRGPSAPEVEPAAPPAGGADARPARAVAPAVAERLVVQEVAWPGVADEAVLARFDDVARRAIERSGVPVLAPHDGRVFGRATVVTTPHWFTLALKDPAMAALLDAREGGAAAGDLAGLSLFVQGTRLAHRHAGIPRAPGRHRLRGVPAWITQNESIWSATWDEHGVTYVAELECSRPTDARCASPALLVELAESLVFVGGVGPLVQTPARPAPGGAR